MPPMIILVSLVGMGVLALFFALFLFFSYTRLSVEEDPRIEQIDEILPQANCGGCGYPGCKRYAEAVVKGEAPPNKCAPGGQEVLEKISVILGISVEESQRKVAEVMCGGGEGLAVKRANYAGVRSCREAHYVTGGDKACLYGCLGYGDCVEACPFDAMFIGPDGLPRVIEEKCTGCGVCVEVCPRGIMQLVPVDQRVIIKCVNRDMGGVARKVCKVSCIACQKCTKAAPEGAIVMEGFLAVIKDWQATDSAAEAVIESCPTNCIIDRKEYQEKEVLALMGAAKGA